MGDGLIVQKVNPIVRCEGLVESIRYAQVTRRTKLRLVIKEEMMSQDNKAAYGTVGEYGAEQYSGSPDLPDSLNPPDSTQVTVIVFDVWKACLGEDSEESETHVKVLNSRVACIMNMQAEPDPQEGLQEGMYVDTFLGGSAGEKSKRMTSMERYVRAHLQEYVSGTPSDSFTTSPAQERTIIIGPSIDPDMRKDTVGAVIYGGGSSLSPMSPPAPEEFLKTTGDEVNNLRLSSEVSITIGEFGPFNCSVIDNIDTLEGDPEGDCADDEHPDHEHPDHEHPDHDYDKTSA